MKGVKYDIHKKSGDEMLQKNLIIKLLSILLVSFIAIAFYSCTYGIIFESLNKNSPYELLGLAYGTRTDSTYSMNLSIYVSIDSSIYDQKEIDTNDKCIKTAVLYFSDSMSIFTEIEDHYGKHDIYRLKFSLDEYTEFNPYDDEYQIELLFTNQDSIVNRYRYKKN